MRTNLVGGGPIPVGTPYDGSTIEAVEDCDPGDDYQPYLYRLVDGRRVWIPQEER